VSAEVMNYYKDKIQYSGVLLILVNVAAYVITGEVCGYGAE